MADKGSCCKPCAPCSNYTEGCEGIDRALLCVPKVVCVTVAIDPGSEELCCPGNSLSFLLFYSAESGECGAWVGHATCGFLTVTVAFTLVTNEGGIASVEGTITTHIEGAVPEDVTTAFTADVSSAFVINVNSYHLTASFATTIAPAETIEHPWNKQQCNPCICARCLPANFCLHFYKTYGTNSPHADCETCHALLSLPFDVTSCTWHGAWDCVDGSYTATISFPAISEGSCHLRFQLSGPDVAIDTTLGLESIRVRSTNGTYTCCGTNPYDSNEIRRQGRFGTPGGGGWDCLAPPPDDPLGTSIHGGAAMAVSPEYEATIDINGGLAEGGDEAGIYLVPKWCGERCQPIPPGFAACCARMVPPGFPATCDDYASTLTMSFIAPQCSGGLNGYSEVMVRSGGGDGACGVITGALYETNNINPGGASNSATQIIWQSSQLCLSCDAPGDCLGTWIGNNPEYLRLHYNFSWGLPTDPCTTSASGVIAPTIARCDPIFLEFEIAVPYGAGDGNLDPLTELCPSLCLEGGMLIIRITE